jgi:glycosyltransferase involved in cell wall biosynthesis
MDLTLCLSNHAKSVLEQAVYNVQPNPQQPQQPTSLRVEKPLEVCFWGVDTTKYYKTDVIEPSVEEEFAKIPEDFAFLFVGQWTHGGLYEDRKDIGNLIKTFLTTFKDEKVKKPCLIIKTSGAMICNMDKDDILSRIKSIREEVGDLDNLPNVHLMYGELTDKEMNSLYNHPKVKAFVTFTHGEGQGDPILQATMAGKPVLAPRWSGQLDYLNPKYALLLDGEVKPVAPGSVNEWIIKESSWFYVDYKRASEKMLKVFRYPHGFMENAEKLRLENVADYSEAAMDKRLYALLDQYVPKFITSSNIILPKLKKLTLPKLSTPSVPSSSNNTSQT